MVPIARIVGQENPLKRKKRKRMDPGWKPAIKPFLGRLFVVGIFRPGRKAQEANGLTALRAIWISLVISLFLFLFVLSFIHKEWSGSAGWWPLFVGAVGVIQLSIVRSRIRRPLDGSNARTLLSSYQQMFFVAFAMAEVPSLIAFVGVFVTEKIWVYPVGLVFSLSGLIMIAPSARNLVRYQQQLQAAGSPLSIVEVLSRPPPAPPSASSPG